MAVMLLSQMLLRDCVTKTARFIAAWGAIMSGGLSVPFAFLALFDVPQRLLFGVLAYVALGIMAISQAVKISRDSKPKLRIECTPNVPGCSQQAPNANFLRVAVQSEGIEAVTECRGYLTRIMRDDEPRWTGDLATLTFAPGDTADATAKTIRDNVTEYLDVLAITYNNEIFVATPTRQWPYVPPLAEIFAETGNYTLSVRISGHSTRTVAAELRFTWTGNWATSTLIQT